MRIRSYTAAMTMALAMLAFPALADEDAGKAAYAKAKCKMCHGENGSGDTPAGKSMGARDLRSDEVQRIPDAEMKTIIAEGKGKMPAFKGALSPEEITNVVSWVRKLGKKD